MDTRRNQTQESGDSSMVVLPKRHYSTWVAAGLVVVVLILLIRALATNPKLDWTVVGKYLFDGTILEGLLVTVLLAVLTLIFASIIGFVGAFARMSKNPVISFSAALYFWVSRSVPTVIQVLFWGNIALFIPVITLGIPGTDVVFFSESVNKLVPPFLAALLALVISNGGYMSEIFRAGLLSVGFGQREAASALGLTWWQAQIKVVIPQAVRVVIPPSGSRFITMLKETALVSVIAGGDILTQAENISARNFRTIELLIVAAIWFLAVTSVSSIGQQWLERRSSRY